MEEILVITACLYQKGCKETSDQFLNQRPALQAFSKDTERKAKEFVGPVISEYLAPTLLFVSGAEGTLKMIRNVEMKYSKESLGLLFKKEF